MVAGSFMAGGVRRSGAGLSRGLIGPRHRLMASLPTRDRVAAVIPAFHVIHRVEAAFAASGDSDRVTHFAGSRDEAVREIEANLTGYAGSGDAQVPSLETARLFGTGIEEGR